jgi:DNA-directed RNA polymerase specialized sigma24 family protein
MQKTVNPDTLSCRCCVLSIEQVRHSAMCAEPNPLDLELKELMAQACAFPRRSLQRRTKLSQLIQLIQHSGRLWRDNSQNYEEALQMTWEYLCKHPENYNPELGGVITWLNRYLRYRLLDFYRERPTERVEDFSEVLPAPPDVPALLERTRQWIESDAEGTLRRTHLRGRPEVNCQVLLLMRLPPPVRWEEIAKEFSLSLSVAPTFYQRKCLPFLRKFGEDEGFL